MSNPIDTRQIFNVLDDALGKETFAALRALTETERAHLLAAFCQEHFLSENARAEGYGAEDADEFRAWVMERL